MCSLMYSPLLESYIYYDSFENGHVCTESELMELFGDDDTAVAWIAEAWKNPGRTINYMIAC